MPAAAFIRGRSRIASLLEVSVKTASRMRARGEIKVETKTTGRPADWYCTPDEIERVRKARGG